MKYSRVNIWRVIAVMLLIELVLVAVLVGSWLWS